MFELSELKQDQLIEQLMAIKYDHIVTQIQMAKDIGITEHTLMAFMKKKHPVAFTTVARIERYIKVKGGRED